MDTKNCAWAKSESELAYHDHEWCRSVHDERKLFEMLILEGMQAGLSWRTVLDKREHMRKAFDNFVPEIVAQYDDNKKSELLQNAGIIRNRAKINALVNNARAFLEIQREFGSFDTYIWSFSGGRKIVNAWTDETMVPATTEVSDKMSKDLYKRGFRFTGSTICYSYMQAIGIVNDHIVTCEFYDCCR